jgi:coniferyl-aldehyde dehydrogenase
MQCDAATRSSARCCRCCPIATLATPRSRYVNAHPRPLALYYFGNDAGELDRVLEETVAGGVTVNDTILHIAQEELPFGGVGPSGMGQYHGIEGFRTFSKQKAVFYQSALNAMSLFNPPYGGLFERLTKFLIR